jgi:hypothetical protein
MKNSFTRLESRLQRLVEGAAGKIIPGSNRKGNFSSQIIEAIHTNIQPGSNGKMVAPNLFILSISSMDQIDERQKHSLHVQLLQVIKDTIHENGYELKDQIVLLIETSQTLQAGTFTIKALGSENGITPTSGVNAETQSQLQSIPQNAFFIINGIITFNLARNVINIGRRLDNHLVIDDPSVSRLHAQLRSVRGQYVLFDLDSTIGTFVNNFRIHQKVLEPGDVILIGRIPLVYGQDQEETGPLSLDH